MKRRMKRKFEPTWNLLKRVDHSLYEAKLSGKNRVVLS